MNNPTLSRTASQIEQGITEHLHIGAQLYVSLGGHVVADQAFGQARADVPMREDTITLWLSSGKPITAVAIGQLWERGLLRLDDPVASYIPEFAEGGKESITLRHILTHTCGIRTADKCDAGKDWAEIIECVCHTPLEPNWVPGCRAGYHPSGSWYILGEALQRVTGQTFAEYIQREIFDRCGMRDCWIGLPSDQLHAYGTRIGLMYHTEKPIPSVHAKWNREDDAAVCRPGRNARGPIRELGRFYDRLLSDRASSAASECQRLLKPETLQELSTRQRAGMFDDTFQQVIDWGLGFAIDSKRYGRELVSYGFGRFASDQTFGHGGAQSSCAFADPKHGLAVAWAVNGVPGERRHQHRAHELNSAIYEDLGLT
jgi:CubicO group peptidase (beta-lactamase class C family)